MAALYKGGEHTAKPQIKTETRLSILCQGTARKATAPAYLAK